MFDAPPEEYYPQMVADFHECPCAGVDAAALSAAQLARLRFYRWLVGQGRVDLRGRGPLTPLADFLPPPASAPGGPGCACLCGRSLDAPPSGGVR
jgi:hypothetical protein